MNGFYRLNSIIYNVCTIYDAEKKELKDRTYCQWKNKWPNNFVKGYKTKQNIYLSAICNPECLNNGACTAPNVCKCPDAYEGPICGGGKWLNPSITFCINTDTHYNWFLIK